MVRNLLLGVVVLALVLGGVYWARGRGSSPLPTESAVQDLTPDVTRADGVVNRGGVRVTLSVWPRPPVAFEKKRFRVRVEADSAPAALEGGRISFEMTMPMGEHRYSLVGAADGWQEAEVVLPFCKSGNPRWYANVEGRVDGRPVAARFSFDLTKPASAATAGP